MVIFRAKRRCQFQKRIRFGSPPPNQAPSPIGPHFNHAKIPKFIIHSLQPANSLQNWTSLVSGVSHNENIPPHQLRKIKKSTVNVFVAGGHGRSRLQSHPQKTKGSTGKIIQYERNEAAKIKLVTALYGTEYLTM